MNTTPVRPVPLPPSPYDFDPARWPESDAGRLLAALGRDESDMDAVSPLRYAAALAPPVAARRQGARCMPV